MPAGGFDDLETSLRGIQRREKSFKARTRGGIRDFREVHEKERVKNTSKHT